VLGEEEDDARGKGVAMDTGVKGEGGGSECAKGVKKNARESERVNVGGWEEGGKKGNCQSHAESPPSYV